MDGLITVRALEAVELRGQGRTSKKEKDRKNDALHGPKNCSCHHLHKKHVWFHFHVIRSGNPMAVHPFLVVCIILAICFYLWERSLKQNPENVKSRDKENQRATPSRAQAKFAPIGDNYATFEELQAALRKAGMESSNLIVGVDFTKSNTWTGQNTFGGRCLHSLSSQFMNPYQTVINLLGQTLEAFDDDKLIPAYGFVFSNSPFSDFFKLW